jgi:amino acid adenylation domain-containing protein
MQTTAFVEGFRLSPQQRRLWALQQGAGLDASAYTARLALLVEGDLRAKAMQDALAQLCARHESLRSTFHQLPGVLLPVQVPEDELSPAWRVAKVCDEGAVFSEATHIEELLAREGLCCFDFERGPLVEATLYELAPGRSLLTIRLPALCADRRTLDNIFAELCQLYEASVLGSEPDDETLQYTQFSEWQNALLEEEDAEEGKAYWNRQDFSLATATALPGGARPTSAAGELRSYRPKLTPEDAAHLAHIAARLETTPAIVLQAAWHTLLWRLTQRPLIVGSLADGRTMEPLYDACGLFARALPVSCEFTDGLRFTEVVAQIEGRLREAGEWLDYFQWEQAETDVAPPYFTYGYEYAELPAARHHAGLRLSVYEQECYSERFDLKLCGLRTAHEQRLEFQYDSAAFADADVLRLARQFETLLRSALAEPEAAVEELELVGAAERRQLLFGWNQTRRDYRAERCIHQLYEEQVERTPDAPAVVFADCRLTFRELNRRANQLAHYLRAQGVGPEMPVGLCLERSAEMLVGVLGILKAGGAYLPLDPRNPHERNARILQAAGASILLTEEQLARGIYSDTAQVVRLDGDREKIARESEENPDADADAANLAYVIYTSGSTGQPKGVMIEHRSAANLAAALREEVYAPYGHSLKIGLNAPLAFDASVKQLLQLLSGHTLYPLSEELRLDPIRLLDFIDEHGLDALDCTPSLLKLLLAAGLGKPERRGPKLILVGGEAIDESLWSRLAADEQTRFHNVYGPTECTVDATWIAAQDYPARPTIGRPIPNARVYILDKNLRPAAIHMTGELYIGGSGVGRGYLGRPALTAERFVPDQLSGEAGARLYRTGDLARYLPDGQIEFLGRNDSQVKLRGHRIELGEVEAALRLHQGINQSLALLRPGADAADLRLVAYVVAESGSRLDAAEVRRAAAERLPEYMVPAAIVVLEELPLTRNGKIDLNALPPPEAVRAERVQAYVAPRNEVEQIITRVWQEVLQVEQIGIHDNFFDAGGHSLLMVQVHNRLREAFNKEVSIVELFRKPTISALAEYFAVAEGQGPALQKVVARAERRKQALSRRKSS